MKNFFLLAVLIGLFVTTVQSQVTDLARLEFTYFPQGKSDNSFRRVRTFINVPIELNEYGYLVPGIGYRNVNLKLGDELPFSDLNLERYQSLTLSLGYTDKMKNDWRYVFQGGVIAASNFSGDLEREDFIFEGAAFLIKDKTDLDEATLGAKPWRLIFGLSYSTTAGRPFPLPIINYYREFAPKWSYAVGVPKSNVKYRFNNRHAVNGFLTLDGFFANIQGDIAFQNDPNDPAVRVGENISMTTALSGLGYEYCFTRHLLFYVYGGWTIINDIRIRDKDANDIYTINETNNIYARTGVKFKL
jgi:hypothetical protein